MAIICRSRKCMGLTILKINFLASKIYNGLFHSSLVSGNNMREITLIVTNVKYPAWYILKMRWAQRWRRRSLPSSWVTLFGVQMLWASLDAVWMGVWHVIRLWNRDITRPMANEIVCHVCGGGLDKPHLSRYYEDSKHYRLVLTQLRGHRREVSGM